MLMNPSLLWLLTQVKLEGQNQNETNHQRANLFGPISSAFCGALRPIIFKNLYLMLVLGHLVLAMSLAVSIISCQIRILGVFSIALPGFFMKRTDNHL